MHEIVHAELNWAFAPSLLEEGAAEVFGSYLPIRRGPTTAELDPLFDLDRIPASAYRTAGRFSRLIIDDYGLDAYFDLNDVLYKKKGREAFATAVSDTLEVELSTLEDDFETSSYSSCPIDRWRFYDYECSDLPLTPWQSETRWSEDVDLSCASEDVIGPRDDLIWTLRAFEVEDSSAYRLTIESDDETASVQIFECDTGCEEPFVPSGARVAWVEDGGSSPLSGYKKGRYWMRIEHAADSNAAVTIALE